MEFKGGQAKVQMVVDGVTGVGKSSLVEVLADELGLVPFPEIFEDKNQLLHKFFFDREKWAFPMQINFLNNRFRQFKEATQLNNAIMDRSIFNDRIFARMYKELGYITPEEFDVYENLLGNMLDHVEPPQIVIYLKVSPKEAIRRIQKRGRPDELEVENEYWQRLHRFYEENYSDYKASELLVIDCDGLDFVNIDADRMRVVELIKEKWLEESKSKAV